MKPMKGFNARVVKTSSAPDLGIEAPMTVNIPPTIREATRATKSATGQSAPGAVYINDTMYGGNPLVTSSITAIIDAQGPISRTKPVACLTNTGEGFWPASDN